MNEPAPPEFYGGGDGWTVDPGRLTWAWAVVLPPQVASVVRPANLKHTVLKRRGLPLNSTKDDIITFFDGPQLSEFNIQPLVHGPSTSSHPSTVAPPAWSCIPGCPGGENKDRHSMGSRYVELFPSSREEATRAATAGSE